MYTTLTVYTELVGEWGMTYEIAVYLARGLQSERLLSLLLFVVVVGPSAAAPSSVQKSNGEKISTCYWHHNVHHPLHTGRFYQSPLLGLYFQLNTKHPTILNVTLNLLQTQLKASIRPNAHYGKRLILSTFGQLFIYLLICLKSQVNFSRAWSSYFRDSTCVWYQTQVLPWCQANHLDNRAWVQGVGSHSNYLPTTYLLTYLPNYIPN